MSGTGLQYDFSAIDKLQRRIDEFGGFDRRHLLDIAGATVESQIRRRITEDKESPDGTRWPDWSPRYAKTRHAGQSLLDGEGDLVDSIVYVVYFDGSAVEIGSNLVYFATHNFGDEDRNIPARESIGLSNDDEEELDAVIEDFFKEVLQ